MIENREDKSRHLDLLTYLEILQMEYVCAELRSKIYPYANDKRYYREREMKGKKEKILNISDKHFGMPTIFSDDYVKQKIYDSVYPNWGFPNFQYKDDEHKEKFENQDFRNYYRKESVFKVRVSDTDFQFGKIMKVSKKNWSGHVKIKGESELTAVSLDNIVRVFN